jgi:hypothetical protein
MNRVDILMMRDASKSSLNYASNKIDANDHYVTFHSRRNSQTVESELKMEDLQGPMEMKDKNID